MPMINLTITKWLFLLTKKMTLYSLAMYSALYNLKSETAMYRNQELCGLLISPQYLYFSKGRQGIPENMV